MPKPRVTLRCPASRHTGPHDRIIEFSAGEGSDLRGGLIYFRHNGDGTLRVEVYNCDPGVTITTPKAQAHA